MNPNPEKSQNVQNEEKILQFWRDNNIFAKTLEKDAPSGEFNFFEGPPTANGRPGIHHVLARSFKDIIPRYKTMRGFHVRRKAGWDTHGLPVELQVEKALGLKSKKEVQEYGIAEFNKKCKESVWTYKDEWEQLTERMGYWIDMNDPYVTYDNNYIESVWSTVKKIDERGYLYRDFRVGPWCTRCETQLASHELNQPGAYKDVKDLTAYVKFKVKPNQKIGDFVADENTYIMAWTTTPWTLPGNVALAVGGDINYVIKKNNLESIIQSVDSAYLDRKEAETEQFAENILFRIKGSDLIDLEYEPLYPFMQTLINEEQKAKLENAFKVYAADFVTTTDGTGIVHIAPMYGADDFDLATKYNLPKFHVVNESGKYVDGCDTETLKLSGRYVKEKDENGKPTLAVEIIDDLTARNLLFKKENYAHSYPHCWRCDTPLLYYARTSWYFRVSQLRDQLVAANQTINWEPDHIRDGRFGEWLEGIKDWAISRDRYWGTPLPVWQNTDGSKRVVIGGLEDIKKYSKKSGNKYFVMRHGQAQSNIKRVWDYKGDPENHLTEAGQQQVKDSGEKLQSEKIDVIITSPILRTQETARIVAGQIGFNPENIITDGRVIEWQVGGDFQEKNLDEYLKIRNASENRYTYKAEGGESYQDVIKRCGEFLYEIESRYQGKNILIVTHNSAARGLILAAQGFSFETLLKSEPKEYPFTNAEVRELDFVPFPHNENYELDFHKPYIDQVELELDGEPLTRTPEVMDVWFDSGSMPIAQDHKIGEPVNFDPAPADYISEGADQTRGWFYTMHAVANMLHDEPMVAYKNVVCLGLLMAADGTKMSKSKGNIVSPWEVFEKFGADVARFWFYSVNAPGDFKNFDEKSLAEVQNKFFRVIDNSINIVEFYKDTFSDEKITNWFKDDSGRILDRWLKITFKKLKLTVTNSLENYDMLTASRALKDFILKDLSQWYIRRSRDELKDNPAARLFLSAMLSEFAVILAPFAPFAAEDVWMRTARSIQEKGKSVHLMNWTSDFDENLKTFSENEEKEIIQKMDSIRDLVTLGLEARQKANIKVRQPLASITINQSLSAEYLDILKDELNVKEVIIDESLLQDEVRLDTEITKELRDEGDMRELIRKIQDMRKSADLVPSDRVVVSLIDTEPTWYTKLQSEVLKTVGAERIEWASSIEKVEKI